MQNKNIKYACQFSNSYKFIYLQFILRRYFSKQYYITSSGRVTSEC
jgi:hypothetical protein